MRDQDLTGLRGLGFAFETQIDFSGAVTGYGFA